MLRRDFLGGIIGVLVSSGLPFVAKPYVAGKPADELGNTRIVATTKEGESFWAPSVSYENGVYIAEPINLNQTITVVSVSLVDKHGSTVMHNVLERPIYGISGDVLKITFEATCG